MSNSLRGISVGGSRRHLGNIAKTTTEETTGEPKEDVEGHPQAEVQPEVVEGDKNDNDEVLESGVWCLLLGAIFVMTLHCRSHASYYLGECTGFESVNTLCSV
jgi:hypothetical protein